ncbi:MAG TPA: hypothetical protein PLE74_00220 [Candidatus Cloacimonadota bacterium]|nr:hypothetical protein [Candidatus Cloacimonadota bacterium]HPT70684.1 hypothetical protein [Candidatus Cloacimonadota bacterium]
MDYKYLKDFAVSLTIIMLVVFLLRDAALYKKELNVPDKSVYSKMSVSDSLMATIQDIERSIQDRKSFIFTVTKDPLKQDLIVQDKIDLLQQWQNMVRNMVRLAGTFIDENGKRTAIISYQGSDGRYYIGDYVAGRKIEEIHNGQIVYLANGQRGVMYLEPIPPRPVELDTNKANQATQSDMNY